MKSRKNLVVATLLTLAACAAPENLAPREGSVPFGVDLSGNWQIQADSLRNQRRIREAIRKTDGVADDEVFRSRNKQDRNSSRRGNSGLVSGGLVYVFLELGESLKVSQTVHGLFISFDRSVVEEFRFGENRMVSIGQAEAQRVTGWEGETLVVETLDRNRMKLVERFRLTENEQVLERTIILRSRALAEETIVQRFDRVAN
jgi:hypothetical protein